jgi:hypothetical protein
MKQKYKNYWVKIWYKSIFWKLKLEGKTSFLVERGGILITIAHSTSYIIITPLLWILKGIEEKSVPSTTITHTYEDGVEVSKRKLSIKEKWVIKKRLLKY